MTALMTTDDLFYRRTNLDQRRVERIVDDALAGCEDGELFLEYAQSESFVLDDGCLKSASFNTSFGFGLRSVMGEVTGLAHSADLSEDALKRASATVRAVRGDTSVRLAPPPPGTNASLYAPDNPLDSMPFEAKVALLRQIDAHARQRDPRVRQVIASLAGSWQAVQVVRPSGHRVADIRPLVRLSVTIIAGDGDRLETGSYGTGGRSAYAPFVSEPVWRGAIDEALRQALVNLDSVPAPAGEMPVVLGPGWPGILLHEAIGHGLEGDFNRKKTSAFAGLVGQKVAAAGITVVDDGTIADRRGSLTIDDEGTPSANTVLIEDGVLKGFMQDRMNARLMGLATTGNGRRESYAHRPMPRMTNTYMLAGKHQPEEILASVKNGLYAVAFGGGQVDITSGKFVFTCTEAYRIEDGKIGAPVKGATLIGSGPEVLTRVSMLGNDTRLDSGIGTCGKDGQSVPVGVGQPTLLIDRLTVGGTAL
ncbi:metalloprotease TldD [Defluviicoccus vanus]|uniref:Metalloprotease TldD n=1 Tax=Defluviicoccus vanus TaxID=111831 RepID=A0A7H1N1Z4_9PROT|nr:metalloprotease TldD [Defluviicoccus vanus]QNT69730.1 metalloprotease TldD [Defluviicoccus vanus]